MKTEDGQKVYWIELKDHKTESRDYNSIPVYEKTYDILIRLGLNEKMGSDKYVIAPEHQNRKTIKRILSNAFHWYWREVAGFDRNVKYKSLRSTYITLATNLAGDQYKLIQKHTKADTTRKHYIDSSRMVAGMFGQEFKDITSLKTMT